MKKVIKTLMHKCFPRHWMKLSRWRWLRRVGGQKVLATGVICNVDTFDDWLIFHEIFELKAYEKALTFWLTASNPNLISTVLDLGGNVGFFSLAVMNSWLGDGRNPRYLDILSIEPSPLNFEAMAVHAQKNAELGVSWRRVNALAGRRAGNEYLGSAEGHYAFSVGAKKSKFAFRAEYKDLDPLTASWQEISLLKCDIEGSEIDLLENYADLLARTKLFCVEIHGAERIPIVLEKLNQLGFEEVMILGEANGPNGLAKTMLFQRSRCN
jgi:FkbM family methyltransferase